MKKQPALFLLAVSLLLPHAHAQNNVTAPAATTPAPAAKVTNDGQWEYLVISFGKTYFSSPTDIAAKQAGQSKLMIFGPLGGVIAQEALSTQQQVDTLGRYGWELIGVLGSIGGDQQWVFKRPFDPDRAAKEAAQIKKEGSDLAAAAAAKPVSPPATELVDLDDQEAKARQAALNKALGDRYVSMLQVPGWSVAADARGLQADPNGSPVKYPDNRVVVRLEVTQRALTGNTYRSQAVKSMVQDYAKSLQGAGRFNSVTEDFLCYDGVSLYVQPIITFNNEARAVTGSKFYCLK